MEVAYRTNDPFHLPDLDRQRLFDRYAIYQNVTKDFPTSLGKEVSKKERVEDVFTSTLTYGELEFVSIGEVFETIKARYGAIRSGGVFYDLGSGTGKGVITGAMLHDFDKCIGIEILDGLYNVSLQLKSVYDESFPNQMQARPDL